jgi:hypothetical protein
MSRRVRYLGLAHFTTAEPQNTRLSSVFGSRAQYLLHRGRLISKIIIWHLRAGPQVGYVSIWQQKHFRSAWRFNYPRACDKSMPETGQWAACCSLSFCAALYQHATASSLGLTLTNTTDYRLAYTAFIADLTGCADQDSFTTITPSCILPALCLSKLD